MNVFVLCTGRCGSTTFIRASEHITNYSAAHESRAGALSFERFNYPVNHIEADNRLTWLLGRLDERYGNRASYVHLKRNTVATAQSFVKRYDRGIMKAYREQGILMGLKSSEVPFEVALDYCHTVNSNIEMFLKDKTRKMTFHLENANHDFEYFCDLIDAKLDMETALREFDVRHNASRNAANAAGDVSTEKETAPPISQGQPSK